MRAKILVDLDSTLNNFDYAVLEEASCRTGKPYNYNDCVAFDFKIGFGEYAGQVMHDIFHEPGWFNRLEPLPEMTNLVKRLSNSGYEIVIVSSLPEKSPTAAYDKVLWCGRYLPFVPFDNLVWTRGKHHILGDLLIDDAVHNVVEFPGRSILLPKPYNRTFIESNSLPERVSVIENAEEMEELIHSLWPPTGDAV